MPPRPSLQTQSQPLCSHFYPPHYRQFVRHLHLLPSQPRCARKSMSVQRQERVGDANYKSDVGLLGGTFVRPSGLRLPSLFSEPKRRLRLEMHWAKKKFESLFMMFQYKFWIKSKPRPKIGRRKLGSLAQVLHKTIYTALAEGDIVTLRKNCTEGILSSFRTRINSRPKNEVDRWTLHKYVGLPRIMSTRMAMLPMDKSAIMQVVIKLKSIQSLEQIIKAVGGKEDTVVKGPRQKKLVEYVVLQKMLLEGDEKPWMVWGTTRETKVEDVLQEESPTGSPVVGKT